MPLPIWLAHKLAKQISEVRRENILSYLTPDGKTQVGVEYRNRRPYRIHSLTVIASQNKAKYPDLQQLREDIYETVIKPVFETEEIKPDEKQGYLSILMGNLLEVALLLILG